MTDLKPVDPATGLATLDEENPGRPLGMFDVLDIYEGGVAPTEPRVEAIATVSAGRMNAKGLPERSTDGTIYLHDPEGRAPGLAAALQRTDHKSLTITFPFDDPRQFIQQRFVAYSKTRLLAYGDQFAVVSIDEKGNRAEYPRETHPDDYARVVATCKTAFSVYFVLVEWQAGQPLIVMPDGLGFYRVRFTGRNSARSFMGHMKLLTQFTSGRLAGIPFDLRITQREVADPTGVKRRIPVFVPTMRVPGMQLDSQNFRGLLQQGITQADRLRLPPPSEETLDEAAAATAAPYGVDLDAVEGAPVAEGARETVTLDVQRSGQPLRQEVVDVETGEIVDVEPTEHDLARLQSALDYDSERARFFATVSGTPLDTDEARADLLTGYFDDDTLGVVDPSSLRDVIPHVDPATWDAFLAHVERRVQTAVAKEHDLDRRQYPEGITAGHLGWLAEQIERVERVGLNYSDRLAFLGFTVGLPIRGNRDLTPDVFAELKTLLGTAKGTKFTPLTAEQAAAAVVAFAEYQESDAAAEDVLG